MRKLTTEEKMLVNMGFVEQGDWFVAHIDDIPQKLTPLVRHWCDINVAREVKESGRIFIMEPINSMAFNLPVEA